MTRFDYQLYVAVDVDGVPGSHRFRSLIGSVELDDQEAEHVMAEVLGHALEQVETREAESTAADG